jgi:hypothetical protein
MIFFACGSKAWTSCLEQILILQILEMISCYSLIVIIGTEVKFPVAPIRKITQIPAH